MLSSIFFSLIDRKVRNNHIHFSRFFFFLYLSTTNDKIYSWMYHRQLCNVYKYLNFNLCLTRIRVMFRAELEYWPHLLLQEKISTSEFYTLLVCQHGSEQTFVLRQLYTNYLNQLMTLLGTKRNLSVSYNSCFFKPNLKPKCIFVFNRLTLPSI